MHSYWISHRQTHFVQLRRRVSSVTGFFFFFLLLYFELSWIWRPWDTETQQIFDQSKREKERGLLKRSTKRSVNERQKRAKYRPKREDQKRKAGFKAVYPVPKFNMKWMPGSQAHSLWSLMLPSKVQVGRGRRRRRSRRERRERERENSSRMHWTLVRANQSKAKSAWDSSSRRQSSLPFDPWFSRALFLFPHLVKKTWPEKGKSKIHLSMKKGNLLLVK